MDRTLMIIFGVVTMGCLSQSSRDVFPPEVKSFVSVTWCPGWEEYVSEIIQGEYMKVSPWPVEITEDGVVAVDHTLIIGGNFLQGIWADTVMHVTVKDDQGNEVDCTNVGADLGLPDFYLGTCDYPLPEAEVGEHDLDLLTIPADTELDQKQIMEFYTYVMNELNHAHVSITVVLDGELKEIACGDFKSNLQF